MTSSYRIARFSLPFFVFAFILTSSLFYRHFSAVQAQPYYAAVKGVSCSACHVNPAGAGVRKISEGSPTFINNSLAVGADLRSGYSNDGNPLTDYTFKMHEQRFYLMAEPSQNLFFSYSNESGSTAEAYGMIQKEEWGDVYARFGRFFIPYGLQISDPDNSAFTKTNPFSPKAIGFSLQPGVSDIGVEVGLAPKKIYFLNLALSNGANKSGTGSAKAFVGRGGFAFQHGGFGLTGFQGSIPSVAGNEQVRYGGFGWLGFGSLAVLGEIGQGYDLQSSTQSRKYANAAYAEIDYKFGDPESYENNLMLKSKFDYSKYGDTSPSYRYTLGAEWFFKSHISFEGQYRFLKETPEIDNDQALVLGHLWF